MGDRTKMPPGFTLSTTVHHMGVVRYGWHTGDPEADHSMGGCFTEEEATRDAWNFYDEVAGPGLRLLVEEVATWLEGNAARFLVEYVNGEYGCNNEALAAEVRRRWGAG